MQIQLKKGDVIELDIFTLAFGGAGIGKLNGMTVFVEHTMPGDSVKAVLTKMKSNFYEAKLVEIIKPADLRLEPKCKYFGICGGCQFQFMPYKEQLKFKKQHVIDALERIGKIYDAPVEDVIGSREEYFYRNKMEFSFGYDAEMNFTLGMHYPGRKFDIMDLEVCYLQSEFSVEVVNEVRVLMKKFRWLPFKYSNGTGFLKGLFIRESKRTNEVMVHLSSSDDLPRNFDVGIKDFVEIIKKIANKHKKELVGVHSKVISRRGFKREIEEIFLHGKSFLTEKMILDNGDELIFNIAPQAFFQVNTLQAEILYSQILKFALSKNHETAFDLFCGTGTIALFLAKHIGEVVGVELSEESIKAARQNAEHNKILNAEFFVGDVSKVLPNFKTRPSLIVIDPPRIGVHEKVIKIMSDLSPKQIVYVSCNPATLARDCNLFREFGYRLKMVQPMDMFPQTYHIEIVCLLERD